MAGMERPFGDSDRCNELIGSDSLEAVLPILVKSSRASSGLLQVIGEENAKSAFEMMSAGKLEGRLGDEIHDFFLDEIVNESESVLVAEIIDTDNVYPITVHEFEGVFFVWSLEEDPVGYFTSFEKAKEFALSNWDNAQEVSNLGM